MIIRFRSKKQVDFALSFSYGNSDQLKSVGTTECSS